MVDPTRHFLPLKVTAAGGTDIGKARKHNEDAILLRPDLSSSSWRTARAGTTPATSRARSPRRRSRISSRRPVTAPKSPTSTSSVCRSPRDGSAAALQKANEDILEIAKTSNKLRGMGTTAVAVSCFERTGMIHVAHVGDSRCYRWRDGVLELLTHDHSLINDALEMRPNIDDRTLAKLPQNVVTRALGMEPNIRVSMRTYRMLAGDKYLLCSDGLSDTVDEDTMGDVLAIERPPEEIVRALIAKALGGDSRDNIAAIVVSCALAEGAVAVPRAVHQIRRPSSMPPPPARRRSGDRDRRRARRDGARRAEPVRGRRRHRSARRLQQKPLRQPLPGHFEEGS